MALPHLIKYVYNSGTDEVIRRGKKIHAIGYVELMDYDDLMGSALFRVKDDSYATYYKVQIQKFRDPKTLSVRCSCPYNLGDICRHESAALFQLQELLDKNMLGNREIQYNQRHTVVKMKQIDLKTIKMLAAPDDFENAEQLLRSNKANIHSAKDEKVVASVELDNHTYPVVIQKNEERNFDTSCTCDDTTHPLCIHKTLLLVQLLNAYGPFYFDSIRNWDKEKNKLLEAYGYSLSDDLTRKFEFSYKDGKPFLRVLDPSIKRLAPAANARLPKPEPVPVVTETVEVPLSITRDEMPPESATAIGIVLNLQHKSFPNFLIEAVKGERGDRNSIFAGKTEKVDLSKFVDTQELSESDKLLLPQLRRFQESEITKYLNRNSPFSGFWENIVHHEEDDLPEETKALMVEYLHPKLQKLFAELDGSEKAFILPPGKTFVTKNLENIEFRAEGIVPEFSVSATSKGFEVNVFTRIDGQKIPLAENEINSSLIFLYNGAAYLWKKTEDVMQADGFMQQKKKAVSKADWPAYLRSTILPMTRDYHVQFDPSLVEEVKDGDPEVRLLLQEKGDFLVFQPVFNYKGYDAKLSDKDEIVVPSGDKVWIIHRNKAAENQFMHKLEALHSQFIRPDGSLSLVLKGSDVLKNNWFFLFVDAMREMKIPVLGFDALKNFRFNTAKPSTKIHISSNTDWFDARVEIIFGDQKVTVSEVKRALANKQQFVQLSDGSLGVLPEEWIKKYSLLFRVGEGKTNQLRLSKYHLSVIDELYENRDEEELMIKLEEKYERLRDADHRIKEIPPPAHLAPILRPYQISGFQWLNYLNEVGWGGILADDMGLGKTIQALSFLHHFRKTRGKMTALVVCPTTLMYNWENEIRKFTPELTYIIHHSSMRTRSKDALNDYDVIITTYGTLRSDIKIISDIEFDYVVLDESQAIKNPASKVTKAASILKSKNRLCLSGTPLQNNTFDIFAQMNFLNPGMLGSIEFFRQEFAVPIDKFGEQDRKEHLRKILYPFILRRTKEQVARDLPEKMETILYCEMETEQRKIYDAYRNDYRDRILGIIDEQGIQKSQLTILQGLMKLRQICDSPAILNEAEKFPNHSIKLDEIAREITENISNHKALIFSQFLGMLGLIREKMKEQGVVFEYFDGSTSAPDRERAIQHFQNDEKCRVFLISLKAGGVGLNLTAADYVYIVDPWWNPAVEQQAIDRTHRIGQTKNIFAYRMICKDTIEDKILQLQEKKRLLARDLIADDNGFVKTLSKADVEYLFS